MDLHDVLTVSQEFRALGDAVGEQLIAVIEDDSEESLSEQNSNALRLCVRWLDAVERYVGGDAGEEAAELRERINAWVNDELEPPRRRV